MGDMDHELMLGSCDNGGLVCHYLFYEGVDVTAKHPSRVQTVGPQVGIEFSGGS